ncbi:MAG: OmpA family protein [Prevotellaceae bacterium]|jgi:chemotaxis protein MotB|nr:OmpA family protein [Prevotellaceae bacterium]
MKKNLLVTLFITVVLSLASCVSQKKFDTLQAEFDRINRKYNDLNIQSKEIDAQRKALEKEKAELDKQIAELDKKITELKDLQEKLKSEHSIETGGLQSQLQKERDELTRKQTELEKLQKEFNENNKRLLDLQQMLANKDEAVQALRRRVADALLGFEGKGLTVTQKNGKVYVSLEEQLLFKSGDWNIESRGLQAIKELAKVLAVNPDINVLVEGHTDNVPYGGKGGILQDNWDLSVKRATTVVRALLDKTGVSPKQVTAAGRSEFLPIEDENTAEARKKNRRTEIILTPKLDELLEILEAN